MAQPALAKGDRATFLLEKVKKLKNVFFPDQIILRSSQDMCYMMPGGAAVLDKDFAR